MCASFRRGGGSFVAWHARPLRVRRPHRRLADFFFFFVFSLLHLLHKKTKHKRHTTSATFCLQKKRSEDDVNSDSTVWLSMLEPSNEAVFLKIRSPFGQCWSALDLNFCHEFTNFEICLCLKIYYKLHVDIIFLLFTRTRFRSRNCNYQGCFFSE